MDFGESCGLESLERGRKCGFAGEVKGREAMHEAGRTWRRIMVLRSLLPHQPEGHFRQLRIMRIFFRGEFLKSCIKISI